MAEFVQTNFLPSGSTMISTSSETQAWRADVSGGVTVMGVTLGAGAFIVATGLAGDAVFAALDEDGNDVTANIKAGYFLPSNTIFKASSPKTGGSVAISYVNPSFTVA